jgi:hypothetical protein
MSPLMQHQSLFLLDFCSLIKFAVEKGFTVTAGELLRPPEMQKNYVETGRSKTLDSNHCKKLAGDLNFFLEGKYITDREVLRPIGEYWESLSSLNRWGGNFKNFKDVPHFERNIR